MPYCSEPKKRCGFVRRWFKRLSIIAIILVVIGVPAGYFAVPKVARSGWARHKIEAQASRSLGAPVHVERVDFTWRGGFVLHNVRSDAARLGDFEAVWSAREVNLRPRACKIFCREPNVTAVLRDPKLELTYAEEKPIAAMTPKAPKFLCARGVEFDAISIENGTVVCDHPSFNAPLRIEKIQVLAEVEAERGGWEIDLKSLTATLNGGTVNAAGRLHVKHRAVRGSVEIHAKSVELNDFVVDALHRFNPMLEVMPGGEAAGAVDVSLKANTENGLDGATGSGEIHLFGASLRGSKIFAALGRPDLLMERFHESRVAFDVKNGRVLLNKAFALSSKGAVTLAGWVGFDESLDLLVTLDPAMAPYMCDPVRVVGTIDQPVLFRE